MTRPHRRLSRTAHSYSPGGRESSTVIAVCWPKSPHRYWNSRATSDHTVLTEVAGSTRNIPYSNRHPHRTCSAPFWVTFEYIDGWTCHGPAPLPSKLPLRVWDPDPVQYVLPCAQPSPHPKRRLDQFSHFCWADTLTDWQTDSATLSTAVRCIWLVLWCGLIIMMKTRREHLSGKPRNVGEFVRCCGNAGDVSAKILSDCRIACCKGFATCYIIVSWMWRICTDSNICMI